MPRQPSTGIATTGLSPYYRARPAQPGLVIGFGAVDAPTLAVATYQLRLSLTYGGDMSRRTSDTGAYARPISADAVGGVNKREPKS